jgi:hypothetical protein
MGWTFLALATAIQHSDGQYLQTRIEMNMGSSGKRVGDFGAFETVFTR